MRKLPSPVCVTFLFLLLLMIIFRSVRETFILSYISIMLAILFHEFGHFAVGYINGVKPQHLIVGFIKFYFERGFHIQFNNNWIYYGGFIAIR